MSRVGYTALVALVALLGAGLSAGAGEAREIVIANEMVLRIRVAPQGMTLKERALEVERRLVEILSHEDLSPPDVQIKQKAGCPTIYVGRHMLITVTAADASANKATPAQLARMWAENVRRQLPKAEPLGHLVPAKNGAPI